MGKRWRTAKHAKAREKSVEGSVRLRRRRGSVGAAIAVEVWEGKCLTAEAAEAAERSLAKAESYSQTIHGTRSVTGGLVEWEA